MQSRDRLIALALPTAFLLAARFVWPDPVARAEVSYLSATILGYGHLLAALGSDRRAAVPTPSSLDPTTWRLCVACWLATFFVFYGIVLELLPRIGFVACGLSIWHVLASHPVHRVRAAWVAAALLAPALAMHELKELGPNDWAEAFSWAVGFHASRSIIREMRRSPRVVRRRVGAHVVPIVLFGCLAAVGEDAAPLRNAWFAPDAFLFWSACHAVRSSVAGR